MAIVTHLQVQVKIDGNAFVLANDSVKWLQVMNRIVLCPAIAILVNLFPTLSFTNVLVYEEAGASAKQKLKLKQP
ncbi:hypothetical protein L6452_41706 [Arctium lappa]|uniref:Uncharacterized protein n=1 Tax=Arctium lappa TaxID=4217 RepID=A0ACB8XNV5_ARCLA|nr:hypothetical protein L6452_41706 [Arctium lappa]